MTVLFLLIVAVVLLVILSACRISGKCAKQELDKQQAQQECPCESCLRWAECNGVDEQCQSRKGNGKHEQN